jgi:Mg-chelatase subunit ChlD
MIIFMGMLALTVDVGFMHTMQAELDRAVDAAALAGVGELVNGTDVAEAAAKEYLIRNPVGSGINVVDETALANATITFNTQHANDYELLFGNWNPDTHELEETPIMPSTIRVSMQYPNLPFFFARVLGHDTFTLQSQATAMFQPRDIVVVLDFSGSMNDDTSFAAIGTLSQAAVEASLLNCWNDLGPPVYGNLPATPTWATAHGVPANVPAGLPHCTVEYRNTSVYVTSTLLLTTVKLEFSNGNQQTFTPGVALAGTFTGSGSNAGKQVRKVWVKSGTNTSLGTNGEYFDFTTTNINTTLKNALGLSGVAYPYASGGSWDGYINYCTSSSNENKNAGYRYKFGGMNLVEYWLVNYPANNQVPDLWKCRAEPMYALKEATTSFMDFIGQVDTSDRVALVVYNASNGNGKLESNFTTDLDSIASIVNQRQAGHYHNYTNIGAGLQLGRQTMAASARPNANKLIVLMTDGLANWNNGGVNEAAAAQMIEDETELCAAAHFKVTTISLGAGADTSMSAAFEEIAKARPVKLVH